MIEEDAYNKNYCSEPTVFSKRSKPDRHLIKPFPSQKNSKEDNKNHQSHVPCLFPERKIKQEITLSLVRHLWAVCQLKNYLKRSRKKKNRFTLKWVGNLVQENVAHLNQSPFTDL